MQPRGTGTFNVISPMLVSGYTQVNGYITATQCILTADAVYARNGYDTRIRSDSGGMFLEMGGIGSVGDLLKFGAYAGVTL
jgi:hypothetical protein